MWLGCRWPPKSGNKYRSKPLKCLFRSGERGLLWSGIVFKYFIALFPWFSWFLGNWNWWYLKALKGVVHRVFQGAEFKRGEFYFILAVLRTFSFMQQNEPFSTFESPISSYRAHRCAMGFDGPHPMGSPLDTGFVCIVRPFPPLKKAPPCLSHGSRWVAPPICGWGHPSAQPIKTSFTPPPQKNYLHKKIPEELFSGWLRHFRVINYAKEFSENYFLGCYVNFA